MTVVILCTAKSLCDSLCQLTSLLQKQRHRWAGVLSALDVVSAAQIPMLILGVRALFLIKKLM